MRDDRQAPTLDSPVFQARSNRLPVPREDVEDENEVQDGTSESSGAED